MQSGITASADLQAAFSNFTSTPSLFALPITITSEALTPLPPISFTSSNFKSSLSSLTPHLQPKTPIYLILRRSQSDQNALVAITYVPSTSPVRQKTLFASTRSSLVRDLGLEKFSQTLFVTDAEEVLEASSWDERDRDNSHAGGDDPGLSVEERELQSVKRAEEEERHGTAGRDLMGEGGSGYKRSNNNGNAGGNSLSINISDDARSALQTLHQSASSKSQGHLVQLSIDLPREILTLTTSKPNITPQEVQSLIPSDKPSYTFYQYPDTDSVIFIYTCPGTSKVKERMVYAASRNGAVAVASAEGVVVTKKFEAGGPEDVGEERIREEVGFKETGGDGIGNGARQGFARPKRRKEMREGRVAVGDEIRYIK